jgi:hypothetical protein
MASGSPETSIRTAPQKHSPEYFAISVSLSCFGNTCPLMETLYLEGSYTIGENAERRLAPRGAMSLMHFCEVAADTEYVRLEG